MKIAFEFDEREFGVVMAGLRKLPLEDGIDLFMRLNKEAQIKAQQQQPAGDLPQVTAMQ